MKPLPKLLSRITVILLVLLGIMLCTSAQSGLISAQNAPVPVPGDYDGDGITDRAVWYPRPVNSPWVVQLSSTGETITVDWGSSTEQDIPVPGDYDGDGWTDYAVWRPLPEDSQWWVRSARTGNTYSVGCGLSTDIPVPGDYNGDGRADYAVWQSKNQYIQWLVKYSSGGTFTKRFETGGYEYLPVPGDYNGDGRTDFAKWRTTDKLWWVTCAPPYSCTYMKRWEPTSPDNRDDIPVPGDYNGDGRTDFAVWRPQSEDSKWLVNYVGVVWSPQHYGVGWGTYGDIPAPGDYDGDGYTDFAVWRPTNGQWYVKYTNAFPDLGTGSVHIVLSDLFRCPPGEDLYRQCPHLPPSERDDKRELVMWKLQGAGVRYGREKLNWNRISGGDCLSDYSDDTIWAEYDTVFDLYEQYDIEPIVQIIATPKNCSHGSDLDISDYEKTRYPPIGCKSGESGDCQYLTDFLDAAVLRYGPDGTNQVHYWEIWNEPDMYTDTVSSNLGITPTIEDHTWFKGTHQDYARLLRVSYERIKAIDPNATVLIGGMTERIAEDTLQEHQYFLSLMEMGPSQVPFDKFNFHDYSPKTKIHVGRIRSVLSEYGFGDREVWITEIGRRELYDDRFELAQVMENKMTGLLPLEGVERVFWFAASDMCPDHIQDPTTQLSYHGLLDCSINPTPYLYTKFKLLFE